MYLFFIYQKSIKEFKSYFKKMVDTFSASALKSERVQYGGHISSHQKNLTSDEWKCKIGEDLYGLINKFLLDVRDQIFATEESKITTKIENESNKYNEKLESVKSNLIKEIDLTKSNQSDFNKELTIIKSKVINDNLLSLEEKINYIDRKMNEFDNRNKRSSDYFNYVDSLQDTIDTMQDKIDGKYKEATEKKVNNLVESVLMKDQKVEQIKQNIETIENKLRSLEHIEEKVNRDISSFTLTIEEQLANLKKSQTELNNEQQKINLNEKNILKLEEYISNLKNEDWRVSLLINEFKNEMVDKLKNIMDFQSEINNQIKSINENPQKNITINENLNENLNFERRIKELEKIISCSKDDYVTRIEHYKMDERMHELKEDVWEEKKNSRRSCTKIN